MKIIAVNGSPRKGGNTDLLLDEVLGISDYLKITRPTAKGSVDRLVRPGTLIGNRLSQSLLFISRTDPYYVAVAI